LGGFNIGFQFGSFFVFIFASRIAGLLCCEEGIKERLASFLQPVFLFLGRA
jgi:hypothetical protein